MGRFHAASMGKVLAGDEQQWPLGWAVDIDDWDFFSSCPGDNRMNYDRY